MITTLIKTFWLTGFSGAGKTTLAEALHAHLCAQGHKACLLDGDILRKGLCRDLGFSPEDRQENMRRMAEVAKLLHMAGVYVVAAFISPTCEGRDLVRQILPANTFVEVHVSTPLAECERRDPKGLYKKARRGEIAHFTGISAPYEAPLNPEVVVDTTGQDVAQCVAQILRAADLAPAMQDAAKAGTVA